MSLPSFKLHVTWRGIMRVMAYVLAFLLVPLLVGSVVLSTRMSSSAPPADRTSYTGQLPAPTYDPTKRIAVLVSSAYGAEINDSLPAFEILARSGAFNVYVVAPKRTVLPFVDSRLEATGLDFVPHFSYAEYAKTIGKTPDLIAIPYFPGYTPTRDAAVLDWIRAHTGPRTTLLGICAGTETLADTGLLAGHKATTKSRLVCQAGAALSKRPLDSQCAIRRRRRCDHLNLSCRGHRRDIPHGRTAGEPVRGLGRRPTSRVQVHRLS